jgi:hypothetical protein
MNPIQTQFPLIDLWIMLLIIVKTKGTIDNFTDSISVLRVECTADDWKIGKVRREDYRFFNHKLVTYLKYYHLGGYNDNKEVGEKNMHKEIFAKYGKPDKFSEDKMEAIWNEAPKTKNVRIRYVSPFGKAGRDNYGETLIVFFSRNGKSKLEDTDIERIKTKEEAEKKEKRIKEHGYSGFDRL